MLRTSPDHSGACKFIIRFTICQGMYFMAKPSSKRVLTTDSGTFLFSSLRISESGLLIPELPAATTSSSVSTASLEKEDEDLELELDHERCLQGLCDRKNTSSSDFNGEEEEEPKGSADFPLQIENAILCLIPRTLYERERERERVQNPSVGFGKAFELTLPELIDFPDFVVEKTRYDAAIRRNWTHRDKCLVWWRNPNGEGGKWWEGRILSSKPKSQEFPDSPWERYTVSYRSDPGDNHLHCPWELHDPDILWEHPHIDDESRDKLLSLFAKLERPVDGNKDYFGLAKLNHAAQKSDFSNRFPVPLYPELICSRLKNEYYRSLEAVKHDIMVMLSNAESYFSHPELGKMRRLSDWFKRKLSRL